ncbi:biopolymer transporter Tol [Rathayibacter sp. VKM Ac-2803]|uniref:TolB family protein n=1 Tax=Rathayibacter sp. VKM Ac-2803 TaxID=2609256 RepID=UPI0013590143|nr:PD40 domain-containing protein [Rathayibacter sp. VKM Ac-2803]MWV49065.1 biopolymer transporter Tol [Rathayibacter sp. VKM Ac-2803]
MARSLLPRQLCRIRVHDVETGVATTVFESDSVLVEAPNWSPDGSFLVVNGDGGLFRLPLDGGGLESIPLDGVPDELNNDHVLAPEGGIAYVSARDGHLYAVALDGSAPARRLTATPEGARFKHYLHGVSPDGSLLALIGGGEDASGAWRTNVYTMPAGGGPLTALTDDEHPDDGVDFAPDGRSVYFNSERGGSGAQIFRMSVDGSGLERVVESDTVDWFPHVSPDGAQLLYLAYPAGTAGHPENLPVELRLREVASGTAPGRVVQRLFGGQGTINVAGWAPDSARFAYADYPMAD